MKSVSLDKTIIRLSLNVWTLGLCFLFALIFESSAAIQPGSKNLGAIWFIGDSITEGNADQDPNGFTVRSTLFNYLTLDGYTFNYTGHWIANANGLPVTGNSITNDVYRYHSGVSGAVIATNYLGRVGIMQNLSDWWTNTSSRLSIVKPNIILIMIGANDANLDLDITNAPSRLSQLISTIYTQSEVGNPTIFVAAITPDRANAKAPANVALFNNAIANVVQQFWSDGRDVYMVDQFTTLNDNYSSAINTDNLHPNTFGNSLMASNWLKAISGYVGMTAPASPCALTAKPAEQIVNLNWSVVPGAINGYNIKRSLASGGPYITLVTNWAANSFIDTAVIDRVGYYYIVTANNAKGESGNSSEVEAIPAPISSPSVTASVAGRRALLSWINIPGASGYIIKRSSNVEGPYVAITTTLATNYTDTNVLVGINYYYVVSAFNSQGEGADSNPVSIGGVLPVTLYIGDDAAEGINITPGDGQDTVSSTLVYAFVQNNTLYTNVSGFPEVVQLISVNLEAGTAGGFINPFVATYFGNQSSSDVVDKTKYSICCIGDAIPVAANSGVGNLNFLSGGLNSSIILNAGAVIAAGYLASGGGVIKYKLNPTGLIDYIYNGNSLPDVLPNSFTADSTYALDRTLKFNIGFGVALQTTNVLSASTNLSNYGSDIIFTATISPAPTNGESIIFMDGDKNIGTSTMTNGIANFTINTLSSGVHIIKAIYNSDNFYYSSVSLPVIEEVSGDVPVLAFLREGANELRLSWQMGGSGWLLQAQTNSSLLGLNTNWITTLVINNSLTNFLVEIGKTNESVFYRLFHP